MQKPPEIYAIIPTAADIADLKAELAEKTEAIKTHAVAEIQSRIESLAAIGLYYTLSESDGPVKPPKPRKSPTCSVCKATDHRAPQHDKVVLQKAEA